MALTTAQLQALKADIALDPVLSLVPKTSDGAFQVAAAYNLAASPAFTVWRSNVTIRETGQAFNGTELAGLTTGNQTRLQTIAVYFDAGYNAGLADVRQMFNDIFSGAGGTTTRAQLLALWKRFATRVEKLFATGTGSDASPANLVFEGTVSYNDILAAWNS